MHQPDLSIGDVPLAACQAINSVKWVFVKMDAGGWNFTVWWQYTGHARRVGTRTINEADVTWDVDDVGEQIERYIGPTSFDLDTEDETTGFEPTRI